MEFSDDKCKVMNTGRNKLKCLHILLGCKLTLSNYSGKKNKLRITVKISGQYTVGDEKGSAVLKYIRNEIENNLAFSWVCIVPSNHGI